MGHIITDFVERGYSERKLTSAEYAIVLSFQEAWKAFTKLPLSVKKQIEYLKGAGYEHKPKGKTHDEKENFHLKQTDYPRIKNLMKGMKPEHQAVIQVYLDAGQESAKLYRDIMFSLVEEIQPHIVVNGCHLEVEIPLSNPSWPQRSLHYASGQGPSEEIAKAHLDKGAITPNTVADAPGFQYYDRKTKRWESLGIAYRKIILMPGLQLQILTGSEVRALWHRVVNSREAIVNGRNAQVVFCDFLGQPRYNKDKHGPTQNLPFGFNLDCSHEEFLKQVL